MPFPAPVSILVLGAGWLYQFLHPLLESHSISHDATTRDGRNGTIPFTFDPTAKAPDPAYYTLPRATTVLVTFPLLDKEAPEVLKRLYAMTHPGGGDAQFVLLGSSGEYKGKGWFDRHSVIEGEGSPRWQAEQALLEMGGCVLNLSGLMGEPVRDGRIWKYALPEAKGKEGLRGKGSVHFVHGKDVSRGLLAVHGNWEKARGQRWLLTDGRVYDWWDLVWKNARGLDGRCSCEGPGKREGWYRRWVRELMREQDVRALPRDGEVLGRRLDSRQFWETFGNVPLEEEFKWAEDSG